MMPTTVAMLEEHQPVMNGDAHEDKRISWLLAGGGVVGTSQDARFILLAILADWLL